MTNIPVLLSVETFPRQLNYLKSVMRALIRSITETVREAERVLSPTNDRHFDYFFNNDFFRFKLKSAVRLFNAKMRIKYKALTKLANNITKRVNVYS